MDTMSPSSEEFPWHLGVHDAHCHPLERPNTFKELTTMKTRTVTVMATRLEDQPILQKICEEQGPNNSELTHDTKIVAGFGWHPWFSHLLYDDTANPLPEDKDVVDDENKRVDHFTAVLVPPPDKPFALALEHPTPLSWAMAQLREHLKASPLAMVGEVGLDKAFRLPEPWEEGQAVAQQERDPERTPGGRCRRKLSAQRVSMDHQKAVLKAQLKVAAEMNRAVSVHGVQVHGVLFELFRELWKGHELKKESSKNKRKKNNQASQGESSNQTDITSASSKVLATPKPFPPRICLHSYSGALDSLKQYYGPTVPVDVYVSFAWLNNFRGSDSASARAEEVIRWVPASRLLVESDLHKISAESDELLECMTRKICELRQWTLEEGVKQLGRNWWTFVTGSDSGWEVKETEKPK
jgi:Tat protein secretion system quality control protein TatD with DNase activity